MSLIIEGLKMLKTGEVLVFKDNSVFYTDDNMNVHRYNVIELPESHGDIKDVGPLDCFGYTLDDNATADDGVDLVLYKLDTLPVLLGKE